MKFPFQIIVVCIATAAASELEKEISLLLHDLEEVLQTRQSVENGICGGARGFRESFAEVYSTIEARNYDPISIDLLKQMDPFTIALGTNGVDFLSKVERKNHTDIDTKEVNLGWTKPDGTGFNGPWTHSPPVQEKVVVSSKFSYDAIREDDFFGIETTETLNSLPFVDTTVYASKSDVEILMTDLRLGPGGVFPQTYNVQPLDMISDESFSKIFFYGLGIPLIAQHTEDSLSEFGPFEVDMPLHNLETRERYRPLGARIHFNKDQKVTAIHDYFKGKTYQPGDEGWEEAKFSAKITTVSLITLREHLVWTHLILSQSVTVYSTLALPPNHPLRRLLTIHTYRASFVNTSSEKTLIAENSVGHRRLGLTFEGMKQAFDFSYDTSNVYEPFVDRKVSPALQALVDEGKFPFVSEGVSYYNIVKRFVTEWISMSGDAAGDSQALDFYNRMRGSSMGQKYEIPVYTGKESMIDLISQVIFTVTAWHELVGYVRELNAPDKAAVGRVSSGCDQLQVDIQNFILSSVTHASTSLAMPSLMKEFPNYFGHGGAPSWEREVWDKFVEDLKLESADVIAADEERMKDPDRHEFKHMDPERFECSVSV